MACPPPELEPETSAAACPVCGSRRLGVLRRAAELADERRRAERFHERRLARRRRGELAERASFTHDYATNLLACEGCGLLLRSPRPRAADIEEAYTEERYPPERLEEMTASQVASFRGKVGVLERLGAAGRVVEIGSFLGGFLEVAREAGWCAVGVDPGQQVAERCRRRGLRVVESTLGDFAARGAAEPYDCVAIWNTFDQLPDPRLGLESAARLLRAGGILALRIPHGLHYRRVSAGLWHRSRIARYASEARLAWNNLLSFPYLYGYGVDTLDRLVGPVGFERVRVQGDVLCDLAGRSTAPWARAEERLVKCWQRAAIALEGEDARASWGASPWLDLYYRRTRRGEVARPRGPLAARSRPETGILPPS
jgi:SAM-dependent methyltransferase